LLKEAPAAIAFLDLSGYTRMTEEAGDETAADQVRRLADLVRRTSIQLGGRLVKMLGDGAMLHFADPSAAVRWGLELVGEAAAVRLPPARVGVNAGPLIQRDGDYFGHTVNVAARVADYAGPNDVLVTADAARWNSDVIELVEIGDVSLRGVAAPVKLYSAKRTSNP
jgi:adenylate cyclase